MPDRWIAPWVPLPRAKCRRYRAWRCRRWYRRRRKRWRNSASPGRSQPQDDSSSRVRRAAAPPPRCCRRWWNAAAHHRTQRGFHLAPSPGSSSDESAFSCFGVQGERRARLRHVPLQQKFFEPLQGFAAGRLGWQRVGLELGDSMRKIHSSVPSALWTDVAGQTGVSSSQIASQETEQSSHAVLTALFVALLLFTPRRCNGGGCRHIGRIVSVVRRRFCAFLQLLRLQPSRALKFAQSLCSTSARWSWFGVVF
jgi:hypothetical protein